MSDKGKDSASIRTAIRNQILAIDRLRDLQALKRAEVHFRMQEIHDLALSFRAAGKKVPVPPVVPAPTGKWSWNGADYIELWRILNQSAEQDIVLDGDTLESFIEKVAAMDATCDRIKRETMDVHDLVGQLDRLEGHRSADRPTADPTPLPFKLVCAWDAKLEMVVVSWTKAQGVDAARFDVCQSAGDPYDPKLERIVGADFASPGRLKPEFGPGVTMRFRVYGRAPNGTVLRSNVAAVTRPLS